MWTLNTIPRKFQEELIQSQCNDSWKATFLSKDIYCSFTVIERDVYSCLTGDAKYIANIFECMYCEQMFLPMKFMKSKPRSCISEVHLEIVLFVASSDLLSDVKNFQKASGIKCHINAILLKSDSISGP